MKILVTRKIPEKGLDLLKEKHEVEVNPYDRSFSQKELIERLKDKDGLLSLLNDDIDKEVLKSNPDLKMIANYAVGYDNIDIGTATKLGIPVSNTPGVLTDTTAEMAWALLFSATRRIVEGDNFTRNGKFKEWSPMLMLGQDVTGETLGLVGAGRIGTAFALKSKGFNMDVLYVDKERNKQLEKELGAEKVELEEVLKKSHYISLHVPLTDETYHLIQEDEFKLMRENAVFINTSRGPVVNEKHLVKALKNKWFFAAGLDVYENEPEIEDELKDLDNVVLQPHAGSATFQTREKMAIIAAENMLEGLRGDVPSNCVNPEVYK